jgi:predicted PolB exonuclease-like 3'-5' exonuclease
VGVDQLIQDGAAVLASTKVCPSLHATSCHVVQVSFGLRKESGEINRKILQWDDYAGDGTPIGPDLERCVLQDAFKMLEWAQGGKKCLVSFNGKQFDMPLLRARAAILGLKVPVLPWSGTRGLLYPYSDETHCDIRLVLNAGDRRAAGTLQTWAEAFSIHAEEHGAEVWSWVRAGEWGKLRQYGEVEATTLVELYERLRPVL